MKTRCLLLPFAALLSAPLLHLSGATVSVSLDKPGAQISPSMWGVFFEDINLGADGGLYAELVKNNSFEFPQSLMGWNVPAGSTTATRLGVQTEKSAQGQAMHFVRVESVGADAVLENEGFRGIGIVAGDTYDFAVNVRGAKGALRVDLVSAAGAVIGSTRLTGWGETWTKKTAAIVAAQTDSRAKLRVSVEGSGAVDLDRISLFPRKTWKQRPGGLRADMVQALADFKPGFLRFPGGCIVEGSELKFRYQWKNTIGPVEERPLLINRWNYEFKHRPTPDYFQTFGLGFFEYFQMCEDIGAEPLPILNCGMACQFNSGELVPLDQLDPFIQDALDLIEFANGPATSKWGAIRASMGHPAPFKMTMLGVGNEQWGPQYAERFARFAEALRAKHPEIKLVGAVGPSPDDERFKYLWPEMRRLKADFVDEHCYAKPEWFFDNAHRYDTYDRNGPKVFMGEYAAQSVAVVSPDNRNTWRTALSEAAYMTGLERNADVVRMASYAPLFGHVDGWQWTPNMIWVDNLRTLRTTNYHVQRLYAHHRGDRVVPIALADLAGEEATRFYASSTFDETTGEVIIKLVNATGKASATTIDVAGAKVGRGSWIELQSNDLEAVNTFEQPSAVAPREVPFTPAGQKFQVTLAPNSFTILRLGTMK
jgi:alpha-L-arabinofuranosidase